MLSILLKLTVNPNSDKISNKNITGYLHESSFEVCTKYKSNCSACECEFILTNTLAKPKTLILCSVYEVSVKSDLSRFCNNSSFFSESILFLFCSMNLFWIWFKVRNFACRNSKFCM